LPNHRGEAQALAKLRVSSRDDPPFPYRHEAGPNLPNFGICVINRALRASGPFRFSNCIRLPNDYDKAINAPAICLSRGLRC
jgi:hypothetical protein